MGEQTRPENDRYLVDKKELVWLNPNSIKLVLTVPRILFSKLLALVHTLHGHAGVGATLALVSDCFHWPAIAGDTCLQVLSCGIGQRKCSRSQKTATMPGRAVEPWETLEEDIWSMGTTSRAGNKYVLLVADRVSRLPFGFSLPSKGTKDVAWIFANLCLTFGAPRTFRSDVKGDVRSEILKSLVHWLKARIDFGPADHSCGQGIFERFGGWAQDMRTLADLSLTFRVPRNVCSDGGGESRSESLKSLCHWLKIRFDFGHVDHSRGQRIVERFGGWLQDILAEPCKAWLDRWDEYVTPA